MVRVKLWGTLRHLTEGKTEVEVAANTFKDLIDQLTAAYPGLAPQFQRGVSMSLDGVIYREAWFQEISPESEVVLMPLMQGG